MRDGKMLGGFIPSQIHQEIINLHSSVLNQTKLNLMILGTMRRQHETAGKRSVVE